MRFLSYVLMLSALLGSGWAAWFFFGGAATDDDPALTALRQRVAVLEKSIKSGDPEARVDLGWILAATDSRLPDPKRAVTLFREAAGKGVVRAQYAMGWAYAKGRGVPMDYAKAASYQTAYLTAYVALYRRGDLQPGEHLLVHGATGGVGMAAVDLGKHFGAQVIGTGGRDDKLAVVKARGADHVINYTLADGADGCAEGGELPRCDAPASAAGGASAVPCALLEALVTQFPLDVPRFESVMEELWPRCERFSL